MPKALARLSLLIGRYSPVATLPGFRRADGRRRHRPFRADRGVPASAGCSLRRGGNGGRTRLAGASTTRLKTLAYVISEHLAALGGIVIAARVRRGDVSSGGSLLMDSVAAALIGFAVLNLRRPNVLGTVAGAVFVGVLLNGLTMLNAPYYTQDFVKGAVLVGALALTYGLGRNMRSLTARPWACRKFPAATLLLE